MRVRLDHQRLGEFISRSELTQNHWAIKLGVSRGHLADLVNGRHPYPSPGTRKKLLDGLGLDFDDLFRVESPDEDPIASDVRTRFKQALSDRYIVDRILGRGGMGTVYLARDVKHGRSVAIKVVLPDAITELGPAGFLREVRLTAGLQHPNILPLLDSGEAAGCPFYVTPFVKGGSVRDLLEREGRLPLQWALRITRCVAEALDEAHSSRILHADIKPENVLLSGRQAILADFGISRTIRSGDGTLRAAPSTSYGTPAYVSPEQAAGDPNLDARSDVYSLACLFYELVSGKPPFEGPTETATVAKRFLVDPPDLASDAPGIPYQVASEIRRSLSPEPGRRHRSTMDLMQSLDRASSAAVAGVAERLDSARVWISHRVADGAARLLRGIGGRRLQESVFNLIAGLTSFRTPDGLRRPMGGRMFANFSQDLRYSFRSLTRRPLNTAVILATLTLGIGVNAAMFGVVNAILIRPLPYPEPDELVRISEARVGGRDGINFAWPNYADLRDATQHLESIAAYFGGRGAVTGGDEPLLVPSYFVTPDFFRVMGVSPAMGAATLPDRDQPPAVLLSHDLWRTTFGADSQIVGGTLNVFGSPMAVVGVMPHGFEYPVRGGLWILRDVSQTFGPSRTAHNLRVVGRLREGSSLEEARTEAEAVATRIRQAYADEVNERLTFSVVPLHDQLAANSRSTLILLLAVVGLVLLIACGNLASILLSQALGRGREMAVRRAVGAGSGRLIAQMLTESSVIGLGGAVLSLVLIWTAMGLINSLVPPQFLHSGSVAMDWRVAVFTISLGVVTGLLFGLLPAWRSARYQPADVLRTDGAQVITKAGRRRLGGLFVVPQYALSLAALIAAGLVLKSLNELNKVDPGFPVGGLITVSLNLPSSAPRYSDREGIAQFHRDLLRLAEEIPGVTAVTLDNAPPLAQTSAANGAAYRREDYSEGADPHAYPEWRVVGPDFFGTIGIPLLRGRDFTPQDVFETETVAIVSSSLARQLWGTDDVLGRRLRTSSIDWTQELSARWMTVVGVAADVHSRALETSDAPVLYAPVSQHPGRGSGADLVVRVRDSGRSYENLLKEAVRAADPELPVGDIRTMDESLRGLQSEPRFRAGLLSGFGALAVFLALLGVYGVMSYSVSQRRKEMAVRVALGAERRDIYRLLTIEGAKFVIAGQILGTVLALALGRLLEGMLFEVGTRDLVVFGTVSPLLALAVIGTTLIPARRAGHVSPAEVLKE